MNITYIILIICLSFNFLIFFYFKWYIKHRTSAAGVLKEYRAEVNNCINEVNNCIVEINAVTDRNLMLVEDKIKEIKEILEDTDRRISVYVKELEKSRTGESVYTSLGRGIRAALKTETQPTNAPLLSVARPSIEADVPPPPAAEVVQNRSSPPSGENLAAQKPISKRQIRAHIDLLVNEGLPREEIASRLDISIAEVDLAMNLRRK